jgi:hypothetical protein
VDWQTFVLALGTFLTGAGGITLVIREFRRHDRKALTGEVDDMAEDLAQVRHDLVMCRRYAFDLSALLADHGHHVPDPPEVHQR